MRIARSITCTLCVLLLPSIAAAQQAPVSRMAGGLHVNAELIASAPALSSGGETWLGLRFILEPGWHLYWLNPGDSGGPPTVVWTPSPGLEPGEFQWPVPERIPYGHLVNYGYHGDVVLPFKVSSSAGATGRLDARVNWLVCKDVCVPGKGRLSIEFPLTGDAAAAVPAWKSLVDEARARVPAAAPATWRVQVRDEGDTFSLVVTTGRRESTGTFFPLDAAVIEDAASQRATPSDRGIRFTLKKSDLLTSTPANLRGVVTLADGTAHVVSASIAAPAASKGQIP